MGSVLRLITCKDCGAQVMRAQNAKYCHDCADKPIVPVNERPPKPCRACGKPMVDEYRSIQQYSVQQFCKDCTPQRRAIYRQRIAAKNHNEIARKVTKYAVSVGFLLHPSNYICMDCGRKQAECYDHRDYSKPLDVDAVCLQCNSSRGRGAPLFLTSGTKKSA